MSGALAGLAALSAAAQPLTGAASSEHDVVRPVGYFSSIESYAADLWDVPRSQRSEWAAVLAEARALGEGAPLHVLPLTDGAAQALLRGGGWADWSSAYHSKPSRFPLYIEATPVGELIMDP